MSASLVAVIGTAFFYPQLTNAGTYNATSGQITFENTFTQNDGSTNLNGGNLGGEFYVWTTSVGKRRTSSASVGTPACYRTRVTLFLRASRGR